MGNWDELREQVAETAEKFLQKADTFPDEATASKALMSRQAAILYDLVDGEGAPNSLLKSVLDLSIAQLHAVTDLEGRLISIERHLKRLDFGIDPAE
ncbi:MAG: hypothetical protein ACI39C_07235 [Dietzia sp.]